MVAASHLGRTGCGPKVWLVPGLRPLSSPPQLTVEKLISKGRVLTMANQVLAVNISEEVSSMSTRDGPVEGLVMTSQVSSLFRTRLHAPSPAVVMPWWRVTWEQAQIKSLSWGPTSWEGSKEEESERMGRGRGST